MPQACVDRNLQLRPGLIRHAFVCDSSNKKPRPGNRLGCVLRMRAADPDFGLGDILNGRGDIEKRAGRNALLLSAGCWLLFIVYGSLVPLDFNPRPLDAAWRDFLGARYLVLGVESRADWVANLLLYMPLGYLLSAVTAVQRRPAAQLLRYGGVFLACAALVLGVEFTQLFFPPRTVSINDIGAEIVGSALGIAVWLVWGQRLAGLWSEMERGGPSAIRAAVVVYVLAYLTLSLFPFDFYISAQELSRKFAADGYGLLMAPAACGRLPVCLSKLGAEVVAVVPLGILLGMALGRTASGAYAIAAGGGLALGLVIEAGQFFIASGISQGVSLLTRAAGLALGVALHRRARLEWLRALQPLILPAVLAACLPYLFALLWYNGILHGGRVGLAEARENLSQVHWLPFYYHYFTSETAALVSVAANVAMYVPVGVGCWLWRYARTGSMVSNAVAIPAGIAAVLAGITEGCKLFVPDKHPDPTNLLIAAASAALAYLVVRQLYRWSAPPAAGSISVERPRAEPRQLPVGSPLRVVPLIAALLLLSAVGIALAGYPLPGPWLGIALAGYGLLIWRWPSLALPGTLALLPLLNFGQWTGWVLVNEFDLLMAVTFAVLLVKPRIQGDSNRVAYKMSRLALPLAASFLISAAIGLFPLQPFDYNAINTYWSNFNALRTLKGFLWAWALLPLLAQQANEDGHVEQRVVIGMVVGLGAEAIMVAWERFIFTGLLNFSNEYRALGTFPELHTGGGDVHAYLVLAIPFTLAWIFKRPGAARVLTGAGIFVLASYALAVTFTRGGYVGYFGAVLAMGTALAIHAVRQRARSVTPIAIAIVLIVSCLAITVPIMVGPFMQARIAASHGDAGTRTRHWSRAMDMMDSQLLTALFGMGLGSFPRTFLVMARDDASATFSFLQEGGNGFVRLGSGRALYFGQWVPFEAGKDYMIAVDLRSSRPDARLAATICEKSEQNSFQCMDMDFQVKAPGTNWQHQEVTFNSNDVGVALGRFHLRRPVFLAVRNTERDATIDIDNVRLLDESKLDLIANGDFSRGGARWYFVADDHLAWHIFNLLMQVLFEQGWLGLLALGFLLIVVLVRLAARVWRGDLFAGALFAGITGFLLVGVTESLFDGPRVTTLFFLLLLTGLRRT